MILPLRERTKVVNFYRPQRNCEGYVFTGVCLSTGVAGVGWEVSASVHAGIPPSHPGADTPQEQTPPKSRHPPEQTPPKSRHPPRYGDYCGRYASYWNAFLFVEDVVVFLILNEKRKAKQGFAYFTVKLH